MLYFFRHVHFWYVVYMYQLASKTKSKHDFLDIIILGINLVKLKKKCFPINKVQNVFTLAKNETAEIFQ